MEMDMRRVFCIFLIITALFAFTSCGETRPAGELLSEFVSAYGAEGILYLSSAQPGEDGYIEYDLLKKIYVFYRDYPEEFAIFLNSHADYGSECGVFVCEDAGEAADVSEMCLERIRLLDRRGEESFVIREGCVVFYSTMSNGDRARKVWKAVAK